MPRRPPFRALCALLVVVAASQLAACSWFGRGAADHREQAERLMAAGDAAGAVVALRNAVRLEPQSGELRARLGDAYSALRDGDNALREYSRAADLLPDDLDVQMKAGTLLLAARRFEDARAKADLIVQRDPRRVEALVLRANALAGLQDVDEAVAQLERAASVDPARGVTFSRLGAMEARRGRLQEAERAFRRAVELSPREPGTHLSLGNFLQATGRWPEAEQSFRAALDLDPKDLRTTRALATFYLATGRRAEAEPLLRSAAEHSPAPQARFALAEFLLADRRAPEARTVLEPLVADARAGNGAVARLALIDAADGDVEAAGRRLDAALQKAPKDPDLLLAKGRVLLGAGSVEPALEFLKRAVESDPLDADAQFWLGEGRRAARDVEGALSAYNEALKLRPAFVLAGVGAARVELMRGDGKAAVSFAQSAVAAQPARLDSRLVLVEALLASGDSERALAEARAIAEAAPDVEAAQSAYARVLMARGDLPRARQVTAAALRLDPASVPALATSVELALRESRVVAAKAEVDAALRRAPRDARLHLLAARVSAAARDAAAGERHLRSALEADTSMLEAYQALGQLYLAQGRAADAQREFDEAARRQPANVGAATMGAIIAESLGEMDEARARYERIVQDHPRAPVAANNLAWLLATSPGANIDIALQHAQAAKRHMPDSAEVDDTLGVVYLKKGLPALAVPPLRSAAARLPANPIVRLHLAEALAGAGDKAGAIAAAEQALALDARFAGAADARALIDRLRRD